VADELHHLTVAQAARLIASRELSPVELTDACLARIAALDSILCSFVTVAAERAREAARRAEAEITASGPRGPLHGIPYALKDIYDVAAMPTTAGSRLLAGTIATQTAFAVAKLEAAGAVLLGKNTTWEFAHGGPSWDALSPPARNPWNTDHSPSGSSSGSAVAVAAGLVPVSLGTDTGGSIRGPAAACGVAGLKPTYGRVSRRGVVPNSFSHDHAGPLAWTCRDLALVLSVMAGHDPGDPGSVEREVPAYTAALNGSVKGLIIGVPWRWFEEKPLDGATRSAFEAALDVFRRLGAELREVTLPPIIDFHATMKVIAASELFAIHGHILRTRPEMLGASLRYRVLAGGLIRAEEYLAAQRARADLARAMQSALAEVNLIMLPTSAGPAGRLEPEHPATTFTQPSFTSPFSVAGNPALSICCGFNEAGLPLSLQIVGALFDEATVLRAGDAYEQATEWRQRRADPEAR
jgi:aspartyl-tRNA(Asn)/glutamyl-tRNA(Gln) amidotransferase subunit A